VAANLKVTLRISVSSVVVVEILCAKWKLCFMLINMLIISKFLIC